VSLPGAGPVVDGPHSSRRGAGIAYILFPAAARVTRPLSSVCRAGRAVGARMGLPWSSPGVLDGRAGVSLSWYILLAKGKRLHRLFTFSHFLEFPASSRQPRLDRAGRDVELVGDLLDGVTVDVVKSDDLLVAGR